MEALFTNWPWWLGGLALGGCAVGFLKMTGLPLGVSRSYGKLADALADRESAARESALSDSDSLEAALRAATAAEFGDAALTESQGAAPQEESKPPGLVPWTAHLVFVLMVIVGGAVTTLLRGGGWTPRFDLGPEHTAFFGSGVGLALTLFAAGTLVGFGTRMGAGCTSGHGLSGCSRGQVGSMVGTACFFAAGVAVSFALAAIV